MMQPDARCLLERSAEVIGAETGHPCKLGQGQPIIEMRLDVVLHALQPLAGQPVRRRQRDRRRIDEMPRDLHRERGVQRIDEDTVEETALHFVGDGRRYLRNQRIVKGGGWLEIDGAAPHHVGNQGVVGLGSLPDLDKLNRYRPIAPSHYASWNKRDLIGQIFVSPHRPIFKLKRAGAGGGVADGVVQDPMIVAAPNTFTGGAGDNTGGNRPPGSCVVSVIPGEAPNRIMLVDASDVWPARRQIRAAATRIRHIPTSPAHASAARNRPGVTPISRRKAEFRWLWSAKPASNAIRARGWLVRRSKAFARSSRRCMT